MTFTACPADRRSAPRVTSRSPGETGPLTSTTSARAITLGRSNWLFAGSLRAGRRAAVIMSLIQSAKLNGHDPYRYLKDVLERLPTHPASRIDELLPHRWQRPTSDA